MVTHANIRCAAAQFEFDCPCCGERLCIGVAQRGLLIDCRGCGITLPGPDFRTSLFDAAARSPECAYSCRCPKCDAPHDTTESDAGALLRCVRCEEWFRQPPPPFERWRRAVARVFTAADQRRSLHHLMFAGARVAVNDDELEPRALRRFEFYCGSCGRLQPARVWDIASQQRCAACRALYIVPSPPYVTHADRVEHMTLWQDDRQIGTYCPQCGRPAPGGDPTRRFQSYCRACENWF